MKGGVENHDDEAGWPDVSRETQERLKRFRLLFDRWSNRMNLVAASTRDDVIVRHIADSLQLYRLAPEPLRWVDLGSGAGFPGLILAIALADETQSWVHLIESNRKKAAFLQAAVAETGARSSVHPRRIEAIYDEIPTCDRIASRALTDLTGLLGLSAPWFAANPACQAWLHKGRDYRRELSDARGRWRFDLVEHRSEVEPDSVILQIETLESL